MHEGLPPCVNYLCLCASTKPITLSSLFLPLFSQPLILPAMLHYLVCIGFHLQNYEIQDTELAM
jgi:hypothetical protein